MKRRNASHPVVTRMATNRVGDWISDARFRLARVSDTPGLDAQVLVSHVIDRSRTWVVAHPEFYLSTKHVSLLQNYLNRCLEGEPLPYLLGHWEFFGLEFDVNSSVLIPRPETEQLVEQALDWLKLHPGINKALDLGTGSGCIAISLAKNHPDLEITATDIDINALEVARSNAKKHRVEQNIQFVQSDLFGKVDGSFSLICANLPYIPTLHMAELRVARYEPHSALDGGKDGLDLIKEVIIQSRTRVTHPGLLLLEIDSRQKEKVMNLANEFLPTSHAKLIYDGNHLPRIMRVEF